MCKCECVFSFRMWRKSSIPKMACDSMNSHGILSIFLKYIDFSIEQFTALFNFKFNWHLKWQNVKWKANFVYHFIGIGWMLFAHVRHFVSKIFYWNIELNFFSLLFCLKYYWNILICDYRQNNYQIQSIVSIKIFFFFFYSILMFFSSTS